MRWVVDRGASVVVFDIGNIRVLLGCYAVDMRRRIGPWIIGLGVVKSWVCALGLGS